MLDDSVVADWQKEEALLPCSGDREDPASNGRVRELVGTYDPLKKPAELKLDADRIKHWLGVGAQPSDTVRSFIKLQKIA